MTLEQRVVRLEEAAFYDAAACIAADVGVSVEEVLTETDRIVAIGIPAAEAELKHTYNLTQEELDAAKAVGWQDGAVRRRGRSSGCAGRGPAAA